MERFFLYSFWLKWTVPLCWKFNSLKNKYFVVGDDSSEFALLAVVVVVVVVIADVTGDNDDDDDDAEHINDDLLLPLNVSLVKFSAISDAIFVNCGPMNACNSS